MAFNSFSIASNLTDKIRGFFRTSTGYFFKSSYLFGQKGAVWIDTANPRALYDQIPQLKTVVDRKSAMFSNMELSLVDKETGEKIEDDSLQRLLMNPNKFQSQNEWLKQYKQQEQIYGNQFMYKNEASLMDYPASLINITPACVQPYLTGKFFDQMNVEDVVRYYEYREQNQTVKRFEPSQIMWSRLTDLDSMLVGCSPVHALKFPLSNIHHAYSYRNVIMSEKGAIGILSNETKDQMGSIPLKAEEKKKIESEYLNQYGVGADQRRVILTEAALKWQPMSYPTKDLMLFEEVDADMITIVDAFGLNINIFSNKNATFENVKQSLIGAYENTLQPEADLFAQKLGEFIGIPEGTMLEASYNHLKILQEDQQKEAQTLSAKVNSLNQLVSGGILNPQQAIAMLEQMLGITIDQINN